MARPSFSSIRPRRGDGCPEGSAFYTCDQKSGNFYGCCSEDACDGGCPSDAVVSLGWSATLQHSPTSTSRTVWANGPPATAGTPTKSYISDESFPSNSEIPPFTSVEIVSAIPTMEFPEPTKVSPSALEGATIVSNLGSVGGPTASPSSVSNDTGGATARTLPQPAIAGIGLGVSIAVLTIISVLFVLLRRRGLLRRWRSKHRDPGSSYEPYENKPVLGSSSTPSDPATDDVFAPFGGMFSILPGYSISDC